MSVPVRLPDGTTRPSKAALARELGCRTNALDAHVVDHAEGYAILATLPDPANIGRRGGAVRRRYWQMPSPYGEEAA